MCITVSRGADVSYLMKMNSRRKTARNYTYLYEKEAFVLEKKKKKKLPQKILMTSTSQAKAIGIKIQSWIRKRVCHIFCDFSDEQMNN